MSDAGRRDGTVAVRTSSAKGPGVTTALTILCGATSVLLILLVLLQRGSGGGITDLLGGSSAELNSSASANRNLARFTTATALVWAGSIVGLGLLA